MTANDEVQLSMALQMVTQAIDHTASEAEPRGVRAHLIAARTQLEAVTRLLNANRA
jgi:hypothetical protein